MLRSTSSLLITAALGATLMLAPAAAASTTTPTPVASTSSPAPTATPTLTPAPVPTVSLPPLPPLPLPTLTPEPVSEQCYEEGESPIDFAGVATIGSGGTQTEISIPGGTLRDCLTSWSYTIEVLVDDEWQAVAGDGSSSREVPPLVETRWLGGVEKRGRYIYRGYSGTVPGPDFVVAEFSLAAAVDPEPAPVVPVTIPVTPAPSPTSTGTVSTAPRPAVPTAGHALAETGSDAGALLPIGALALVAGAAALVTARLRRRVS
ncbi:hypothetical protein NB037_14290 [Rathayibacter sp. ZW T2_19]|uniref:Gram-positive cocci surface proteins LPxTG domain-containing protein n=1 Tax=Rathayibacter rubneri TaxID=2950106 RepID=A0A9X2IVG4_9MICO|nr:hypothetical protein [Rathayibacter rubneri]MCM6763589.1 hypothetical protein [Rathayibacter rubneri]